MDQRGSRSSDVRKELMLYLAELAVEDPREAWKQERQQGLWSGIDEVFHFFFDDHDFDDTGVGDIFFDHHEVEAVERVKHALNVILQVVGNGDDNEFVEHPLWRFVTHEARTAQTLLGAQS